MPTLVTYEALALEGKAFGLSPESVAKIETVRSGGMVSLSIMREAGLPMAFGSDLLGQLPGPSSPGMGDSSARPADHRDHSFGDARWR